MLLNFAMVLKTHPRNNLVCLVLITLSYQSYALARNDRMSLEESDAIKEAIVFIIENFYRGNVMYISNIAIGRTTNMRQRDVLTKALREVDCITWYLEDGGYMNSTSLRVNNIILVDSYLAFRVLSKELRDQSIYDATGYYLIVLFRHDSKYHESIYEILLDCWKYLIVNVLVLVEPVPNSVYLYSYFPFTQFHCGYVVPVITNSFENGEMTNTDLFPRKARNLHGCPLSVMTWHSPPFVIKITKDDGSVYLDGVEGSILNHLAKHMNFTVVLIPPPVEGFSGARLFTNGTATGIFGVIKRGEVDITIGSLLYSSRRAQVLGVTMPHYQQPLVITIRRGLSYSSLESLLYPFNAYIWIALCSFFLAAAILMTVFRCFTKKTIEIFIVGLKNTSPLYNMWVAAIGGQVNPLPGRNFARFMLMLWLLITAVLRGTYQGALYNFIRTNVEKELPNTLEELWKEKYSIWIDSLLAEWALPTTDLEKFNKIPVKVDFSSLYEFQNTEENIGFLIARDMVIHFNNLNYWEGRLYIVNERLLMQQYSMLFRKYSYLIVEVNGLVIRYSSSGLIMKWSKNFNTEKFAVDKVTIYPKQFSNQNLIGAYQIYTVLIGMTVFVFIIEIFSHHFIYTRVNRLPFIL